MVLRKKKLLMTKTENKSVLVIFGGNLPQKNQKWYQQFSKIIYPEELNKFISPGSIQEANKLVDGLSQITVSDGKKISKIVNWRGYELWWVHYGSLMSLFCLPYTQYRALLSYLKDFDSVYLYQAPFVQLFRYFLSAYGRECFVVKSFGLRKLMPLPFGVFLQLLISIISLPWLKIKKPKLMVWTSDKISPPYNFEYRNKSVFKELIERKIYFAPFMRSIESWPKFLENAWRRKRAVIYSSAIIELLYFFSRFFGRFKISFSSPDPEKRFQFLIATHYLRNVKGTIWSISAMKRLIQWLGIKAAYVNDGCDRTFHELLGCKLAGIKTVGIQHAATSRYAYIPDFMPGFEGDLPLSVDRYGLWSEWWLDYYLKYSRAYRKDQLFVSGPCNPVEKESVGENSFQSDGIFRVLFVSEQLADPSEIIPYLSKLLETKEFAVSLKFRPYRDGFEKWLEKNRPDILEKVGIFRGTPQQAAVASDVVVGSHSSAVLEGLLQSKPIVFFWTNKWGDYFDLKDMGKEGKFFALNPEELVDYIKESKNMPQDTIKQLQKRFFGDPNRNGGKWVVDQALELVKNNVRQ